MRITAEPVRRQHRNIDRVKRWSAARRPGVNAIPPGAIMIEELLPPDDARHLARELRWMVRKLGPVRDLDVLQSRLRLQTAYTPQTVEEDALTGWVAEDRRCAARSALIAARSARALLLFAGLNMWLRRQSLVLSNGADLTDHILPRLEAQDTAILDEGRGISRLHRTGRHRLRSKIKALRYALEALPWLCPSNSVYTSALRELQTVLGDMNDDAVGERLTRRLCSSHGLDGSRHRNGPSARERKAALEAAWTQFQECGAEWLHHRSGAASADRHARTAPELGSS